MASGSDGGTVAAEDNTATSSQRFRSMPTVYVKFVDVASRAIFTVGVTYSLPLAQAGRFGLFVTMIGLAAFTLGWERHIDLQRRLVGHAEAIFDASVFAAARMYLTNAIILLPLFAILCVFGFGIPLLTTGLVITITLSEMLANQMYNIALVQPRYFSKLVSSAAKNLILIAFLAIVAVTQWLPWTLETILAVWAGISVVGTVVMLALWYDKTKPVSRRTELPLASRIPEQWRVSLTHFLIGGFVILSIQFDRLTVGAMLPLDQVGIYFRHILAVSFVYQFFNIASYNRLLPAIFERAKTEPNAALLATLNREWIVITVAVGAAFAVGVWLDWAMGQAVSKQFALNYRIAAVLLLGSLLRVAGDYRAMVLNAAHRERRILLCQVTSFAVAVIATITLTQMFGILGAAIGMAVGGLSYFLLAQLAVQIRWN
ncbi:MAG: hypothetical protein P8J20_08920 [Novosphingobium sp.]|nr:hypothetical protein [Novosphingobium sp.]